MAEQRQPRRPVLRMKEAYRGVAEITGMTAGRDQWNDNDLTGVAAISLPILSDDEMIREVKIFLTGIKSNMTPRSIASALVLTWNMRSLDPIEKRIFPIEDSGEDPVDIFRESLEKEGENYIDPEIEELVQGISGFEARRSGAFLAASTLRMFSKDASSWSRAWDDDHFSKRYTGFTKCPFPLEGILYKIQQLEVMYDAYQGQRLYLGTLGRILYALADVKDQRQTSMLFEQHLSCTGMHIVPQFINAKIAIGATSEQLLLALDMGQNTPTLNQLADLINSSLSQPLGPDNRGTWRYARLFDPTAFSLLQTKYAQDTVAVLAHMNEMAKASNPKSNPLNIAVLKQMGAHRLSQAKIVAYNIVEYFTVTARGETSGARKGSG